MDRRSCLKADGEWGIDRAREGDDAPPRELLLPYKASGASIALWGGGREPEPDADATIINLLLPQNPLSHFTLCSWSPSGDRFAAVDSRANVYACSLAVDRCVLLHRCGISVDAVAVAKREPSVLVTTSDRRLLLIHGDAGGVVATLRAPEPVVGLTIHPNCSHAVGVGRAGATVLWDLASALTVRSRIPVRGPCKQAHFDKTGRNLLALEPASGVCLVGFPGLARLGLMHGGKEWLSCFSLSGTPSGEHCLALETGRALQRLLVWNVATLEMMHAFALGVPAMQDALLQVARLPLAPPSHPHPTPQPKKAPNPKPQPRHPTHEGKTQALTPKSYITAARMCDAWHLARPPPRVRRSYPHHSRPHRSGHPTLHPKPFDTSPKP